MNEAEFEVANTAYCELAGLLEVLRSAAESASPPPADAVQTIAGLALERANTIGAYIADLPSD